ncbi:hypothetical protein I6F34_01580 [Bradyrhizobium sp. BRP05]|nr:hypothetical protein [Bradyrhizobium sp. BRP05]
MPRKPKLSPAQVRFMDEHVPAFIAWMQATGQSIGIKVQPWQKRIIEALIRKDFLEPDGKVTFAGVQAWQRATDKAAAAAKIQGNRADLVIVDDI